MAWWDGLTRGECRVCGEPARNAKAFYCQEHTPASNTVKKSSPKRATKSPAVPVPEGPAPDPVDGAAGPLYSSEERRPTEGKAPKPGIGSRLFGGKTSDGGSEARPPATSERRPAVQKKRATSQATAEFWGSAVEAGSAVVARTDYVPMARAMVWSSPVAGEIIEEATRGTPVDRLIQPLVRNGEKWTELFDLIGFWGAIGMAQANPAQAPAALGFARKRLVNLLPKIAANITKQRAAEKRAVEALTEVMPDLREMFPDADPDSDPVDLLLQMLFAAPQAAEPVSV